MCVLHLLPETFYDAEVLERYPDRPKCLALVSGCELGCACLEADDALMNSGEGVRVFVKASKTNEGQSGWDAQPMEEGEEIN